MKKILLILFVNISYLYSDSIDIGLRSYHIDNQYNYNENNFGIIYNFSNKERFSLGYVHKNSYHKPTGLMKINTNYKDLHKFGKIRLSLGILSGYKKKYLPQKNTKYGNSYFSNSSDNGILPAFFVEYKIKHFKLSWSGLFFYAGINMNLN